MPLVISKPLRQVDYLKSKGLLAQILTRGGFDGREWAIGDLVVFEDGTFAVLERCANGEVHTWSKPAPMTPSAAMIEVKRCWDVRLPTGVDIPNFERLFAYMSRRPSLTWPGLWAAGLAGVRSLWPQRRQGQKGREASAAPRGEGLSAAR